MLQQQRLMWFRVSSSAFVRHCPRFVRLISLAMLPIYSKSRDRQAGTMKVAVVRQQRVFRTTMQPAASRSSFEPPPRLVYPVSHRLLAQTSRMERFPVVGRNIPHRIQCHEIPTSRAEGRIMVFRHGHVTQRQHAPVARPPRGSQA